MKRFLKILIIFIVFGCQSRNFKEIDKNLPDEEISNFKVLYSVNGIRRWELCAGHAFSFGDTTLIYGVTLSIYDSLGNFDLKITADSGILYQNNMEALGNVTAISKDSIILKTHKLQWIDDVKKVYSPEVLIIKEGKRIRGKDFESDQTLNKIKMRSIYGAGNDTCDK